MDALAPIAADVFTTNNHSEYDINGASALIGLSMRDNDTLNPLAVLEEFITSNNPDVKKLLLAKKNKYNTKEDDGFYDIYENMLIEDYVGKTGLFTETIY